MSSHLLLYCIISLPSVSWPYFTKRCKIIVVRKYFGVLIVIMVNQQGIPISWTKGYLIASSVIISWQLSR